MKDPTTQKETKVVLDCVLAPKSVFNLFSATKILRQGGKLGSKGETIILETKGGLRIYFDKQIKGKEGYLAGTIMRTAEQAQGTVCLTRSGDSVDARAFHDVLGHPSNDVTRATASKLKMKLTGEPLRVCED